MDELLKEEEEEINKNVKKEFWEEEEENEVEEEEEEDFGDEKKKISQKNKKIKNEEMEEPEEILDFSKLNVRQQKGMLEFYEQNNDKLDVFLQLVETIKKDFQNEIDNHKIIKTLIERELVRNDLYRNQLRVLKNNEEFDSISQNVFGNMDVV